MSKHVQWRYGNSFHGWHYFSDCLGGLGGYWVSGIWWFGSKCLKVYLLSLLTCRMQIRQNLCSGDMEIHLVSGIISVIVWEVWVDIGGFGSKGLKGLFVIISIPCRRTCQVSQHFSLEKGKFKRYKLLFHWCCRRLMDGIGRFGTDDWPVGLTSHAVSEKISRSSHNASVSFFLSVKAVMFSMGLVKKQYLNGYSITRSPKICFSFD